MKVFKGLSQTILNGFVLDEAILISMDDSNDDLCSLLGNIFVISFKPQLSKEIGLKSFAVIRLVVFWNQGDERVIQSLQIDSPNVEICTQPVEVMFDDFPTFLKEEVIKSIRARRFVRGHIFYHQINYISREGIREGFKGVSFVYQLIKVEQHSQIFRSSHFAFENIVENSCIFLMVTYQPTIICFQDSDSVFSKSFSQCCMEGYPPYCTAFHLIFIFIVEQLEDMLFKDSSEISFLSEEVSPFFNFFLELVTYCCNL